MKHTEFIEKVAKLFREGGKKISPKDPSPTSNMMCGKNRKSLTAFLGMSTQKNVLSINIKERFIHVEPGITMEELVDATLPYGLIPPVVPEFKGISVGGAINGAALESSSHGFGQFNDTCLSYEVMTGTGQIIQASPTQNSDLFYALSGSYGTLGLILSVKIRLIPTAPWVKLNYNTFSKLADALAHLTSLSRSQNPPSYMEAILFTKAKITSISGSAISSDEAGNYPQHRISSYSDDWFYSHADRLPSFPFTEAIPLKDYLFRHDRGAFWMGGYSLQPAMTFRYLAHKCLNFFSLSQKKVWLEPKFCTPKNPNRLFRFLFGGLMKSRTLYKSLHNGSEGWFKKNFAIQDFYLPEETVLPFIEYLLNQYKITPLWVCPIRSTSTGQIFSPHHNFKSSLLFDVGIYGIPFNAKGDAAVRLMEQTAHQLNGRKMLYSANFIPKEEFWTIYSEKDYQDLRNKYGASGKFPDITEKVLRL